MACGIQAATTIELPAFGIEVRPTEVDIRMQQRHYARAQFKLPEQAARLLAANHTKRTLAFVKIDGEIAHRMVMLEDAVSFDYDLNENVVANLDLFDARKVLEQQSIEKSFKDVNVRRVVEFLLNKRTDPQGVIRDYRFVQEGDSDLTATTSWPFSGAQTFTGNEMDDEFNPDFDLDPFRLGTKIAELLGVAEKYGAYTFDFEGETILGAFEEVMNHFGLNWWVSDGGTLYIGPDGSRGQIVASASGDNQIALSRYTVTREAKSVRAVQVHATAMVRDIPSAEEVQEKSRVERPMYTPKKAIAEAIAPDIEDGSVLVVQSSQTFDSLQGLERNARRLLYQKVMGDTSGSLEINANASRDVDAIRDLDVGDYFYATDGISTDCNQDVVTGVFLITSIHHRATPRRGWNVSVEVSRIPDPERLETASTFYEPEQDKAYDTLETYQDGNFPGAT